MADEPLVMCKYGWRQVVRLYRDYLVVGTTHYALADLIYVRPTCHRVLHKPSLRLELCFKGQIVVLRGIADLDAAQKMTRYLLGKCASFEAREPQVAGVPGADSAVRAPTESMPSTDAPAELVSQGALAENNLANIQTQGIPAEDTAIESPITPEIDLIAQCDTSIMHVVQAPAPRLMETHKVPDQQARLEHERAYVYTEQVSEVADGAIEEWQRSLNEQSLPLVQVPLRLLDGENAHYSTPATRCGELSQGTTSYRYRVKDQGILILTDLRMIYLGRKSQVVLNYAHLVQVSRQHGALAFLAEHWVTREVFKISSPLECTIYLDHILRRFKQHSRVDQQALIEGVCQPVPDTNERERQNRARLADKDTQEIARIGSSGVAFVSYEQHMEWLSQLGDLR